MKKFEGILLTTDLDGTLLRGDKTISEENLRAIEYFKSEGGTFTFITGRIPPAAKHIADIVKPNAPCGCFNGNGIYDYRSNELLWYMEISPTVLELVEYIDKNLPDMGIEVCTFDKIYFHRKNSSAERHRNNEKLPDLVCHYSEVKEPIAKILFADENEQNLLKLIDLLKAHPQAKNFDFIRSDVEYYEILPKGVSKGKLIQKLAEILGIDAKKTIAVGDNENDVSMLRSAQIGFAVANAFDGPKAAADYITVSNEEHAIAKIIDDLDKCIISV